MFQEVLKWGALRLSPLLHRPLDHERILLKPRDVHRGRGHLVQFPLSSAHVKLKLLFVIVIIIR